MSASASWYETSYPWDSVSKRYHQTEFLRMLILQSENTEREQLLARMAKAERDEHCSRCALILMLIMSFVSLCAVCYSVVLLPDLLRSPSPAILKSICLLGLASAICSVTFFFCWIWYRGVLNQMQAESRRFVLSLLETQPESHSNRMQRVALGQNGSSADSDRVSSRQPNCWNLIPLQQAS